MNKKIVILIIILIVLALFAPTIIQNKKKDDSLKEKIGQMLIIGFRGTEVTKSSSIVKTINNLNIGGIILFDKDVPSNFTLERNINNPEQTKKLIEDLKSFTSSEIFVAVDAEGGFINRLKEKYGFINIPSHESLGKEDKEKTKEYATLLSEELKALGFNVNFAPVVDVNVNPDNPVIGYLERSFSNDPNRVAEYASMFIQGMHNNNIITSIKHFPGHGSSTADSHLGMVDVTNTYQQEELIPYQALISNGYNDIVMTAHIINTNIDPNYPATLSPLFIKKILREDLNYNGVVISDDMQMGAIVDNYGFDEALIKAINAGCDMLIISNNGKEYNEKAADEAINIILKAVKKGEIKEEDIIKSYEKIQELKARYDIKK